jgi:hypothetical protein
VVPASPWGKDTQVVAHEITLVYPEHLLNPVSWVNFIELRGFQDDWKSHNLTEDDLWLAQTMIGAAPKGCPVIKGTGGLRKMRFSPAKSSGRRKWYRLCDVYFEEASVVLLVVAYAKNESDDIPAAHKKYFRQLIRRENAVFCKGAVR